MLQTLESDVGERGQQVSVPPQPVTGNVLSCVVVAEITRPCVLDRGIKLALGRKVCRLDRDLVFTARESIAAWMHWNTSCKREEERSELV